MPQKLESDRTWLRSVGTESRNYSFSNVLSDAYKSLEFSVDKKVHTEL